jgi:uncharacterized protein with von Willebrand factor type A (vWA) domain
MPLVSLTDLLGRGGRNIGTPRLKLSDWTVTHDSIDQMEFANFADESPSFRRIAVENAPQVALDIEEPDPIDMTTATPDQFIEYQQKVKAAREAKNNAPAYTNWKKLTRDVFASYHTHDQPEIIEPVDPGVELHKRILPKIIHTDDHADSRNSTRDNPTLAAIATMGFVKTLRELLGDELKTQAEESQTYQNTVDQVEHKIDELGELREMAADAHAQGEPIPPELRDQIKQLVQEKRNLQQQAAQQAQSQTPMSREAMQAIESAAKAASDAVEAAKGMPSFGAGFGPGEPTYQSPEQALTIAEMWANNPMLRRIAELFGRLDRDMRFQRSKRIVGGNDEIVDVEFGDNLARVLPHELALFSDEDLELDFLARYADAELLQFSTVGEEHAGRGPILVVVDGSGSMQGEKNIWARAVSMCLLHIARLEKRDFACIEFASARQVAQWVFYAKQPMDAQQIVDMASHFFGGGTSPIQGVQGAVTLMQQAPPFKKADLVMIGDGEAGFGPEDKRLRDQLVELGVRLFGIAIGGSGTYQYLTEYCESTVHVSEFELQDPSRATAELATHVT